MYGARMNGTQKLVCELTIRDGKVVYDLNGVSRPDWKTLPPDYKATGNPHWDGIAGSAANGGAAPATTGTSPTPNRR
jgi:dihydroorotase